MASELPELAPEVKSPPNEVKKGGVDSKDDRICLVCGDRANGVHYNVLSCEGCKSFFLRSAKSKASFTCSQGGTCSMDLYTRRHCPACRMQRCKELGMSLDRVWDNERLKTRKPLVRVKRKKKVPPAKSPPAKIPAMESIPTSSGLPVSPGMVTTCLPLSTPSPVPAGAQPIASAPAPAPAPAAPVAPAPQLTQEQLNLLEGLERGYTASKEVLKNIFPRASPIVDQDGNPSGGSTSKDEMSMPLPTDSASSALAAAAAAALPGLSSDSASSALMAAAAEAAGTSIDRQLQQFQAEVGVEGAMGLMSNDPVAFSSSLQRVTSFITNGSMSNMLQNQGKPKLQICKELLHIAMDMFAILVKQTIHFAKTIPGFVDLTCDDQAVLIKASIIDAMLLRCAENFVPDKNCLINDMNGEMFSMKMMYQLGYTTFLEPAFQFMRETKACGLTTAEYALLNGVAILSPDRTELRNRELVEQMQQNLILTLYQSTKVYHGSDKTLFAKLIMKLATLRDIAVVHLSDLMDVKVREGDLSPLIAEIFGLEGT